MKAYLLSLLAAAFLAAAVGILAPEGAGLSKHLRLLTVLAVLCVAILPLPRLLTDLRDLPDRVSGLAARERAGTEEFSRNALDAASRAYIAQNLTARICEKFAISADEVKCAIRWEETDDEARPQSVTLILYGSARWKDPHEIASFAGDLLGCPCETAVG